VAFLRFSRDRRGYENTFLLHAATSRGEKDRPRLLYWFRTPPHLKVGRTPFDEDAMRLLEDQYPAVEFDWSRLLETPTPSSTEGSGREGDGADFFERPPESPVAAPSDSSSRPPARRRRRRGGHGPVA
jgi:hypothetical protein